MAQTVIGEAFVRIRAKADDLNREVAAEFEPAGVAAGKAFVAGLAAVKIKDFILDGLGEAEAAQRIANQTEAVLRSTGNAAGITAADIDKLTESLMRQQVVDDDLIRQGANLLLTFKAIRNEVGEGNDVFDRAVAVSVDLSKALGGDVSGAAIQVGKALQDPERGLLALTRAGVSFSASQKETIERLVETGQVARAQKLILDELESQFGGSAAAQATAADRARLAWAEFKEEIGTELIPVVEVFARAASGAIEVVSSLPAPVRAGGIALAGLAATAVALSEGIQLARQTIDTLRPALTASAAATEAKAAADLAGAAASGVSASADVTATAAEIARAAALQAVAAAQAQVATATAPAAALAAASAAAVAAESAAYAASAVQLELFTVATGRNAAAHATAAAARAAATGQLLLEFTPATVVAATAQQAAAAAAVQQAAALALVSAGAAGATGTMAAGAAAAQALAVAETEAAVASGALTAALAPLAIAAAALVAVYIGLNSRGGDFTVSSEAASEVLRAETVELAKTAEKVRALGKEEEFFRELVGQSTVAGARYIEVLREQGVATDDLQAILDEETEAAARAKAATDRLSGSMGETAEVTARAAGSYGTVAYAIEQAAAAAAAASAEIGAAAEGVFGAELAQRAFTDSLTESVPAAKAAGTGAQDYARRLREIEAATRSVTDAQETLREAEIARFIVGLGPSADDVTQATIRQAQAVRSVADAHDEVAAAEQRVRDAQTAATLSGRARLEGDELTRRSEAAVALERAQIRARDVEARLNEVRKNSASTADQIRSAELDYGEALQAVTAAQAEMGEQSGLIRLSLEQEKAITDELAAAEQELLIAKENATLAEIAQREALQALNEERQRGLEGSRELADANRAVEEASRSLEDAERRLVEVQTQRTAVTAAASREVKTLEERMATAAQKGAAYIQFLIDSGAPADEVARATKAVHEGLLGIAGDSPTAAAQAEEFFRRVSRASTAYIESVRRDLEGFTRDNAKAVIGRFNDALAKIFGQSHGGSVVGVDPASTSFDPSSGLRSNEKVRIVEDGQHILTAGQAAFFRDALIAAGSGGRGGDVNVSVQVLGPVSSYDDARRGAEDGVTAAMETLGTRRLVAELRGASA